MSALPYQPNNEEEIFRLCTKECGIITATEDQQFFALGCMFCTAKFLYFDAFIGHMQTEHGTLAMDQKGDGMFGGMLGYNDSYDGMSGRSGGACLEEDLTDADPSLLVPQMVMIKEEVVDEPQADDSIITGFPSESEIADANNALYQVKQEHAEPEVTMEMNNQSYMCDPYGGGGSGGGYDDYGANGEDDDPSYQGEEEEDANYDDLVEQSLLGDTALTMHIKDRKMIQFLIDSYRRNPFLWDHRHPQFRDRVKRQQFLDWVIMEFKRRFNISLAKDAVTRKWDNLRTVYKRECNRMSLEKTNISTLWYFKELHFLNRLYGGNQKMSEAVVKETVYRRRYSALWNDVSTTKLLAMVEQFPCFYDKYNIDYRSKEKRGEALQKMAAELQKMIDVTTIQISKRISQLRFDYSKQKQERLQCEQNNKVFVPSYTYYDQMFFMDADVAPFKCDFCTLILQTPRELDVHLSTHQGSGDYVCNVCHAGFVDMEMLQRHRQVHTGPAKEVKYACDLCTASFRTKSTYDEHMRRHNDELLLPSLANNSCAGGTGGTGGVAYKCEDDDDNDSAADNTAKPYICDICGKAFATNSYLNSHRAVHSSDRVYKCEYPHCGKHFATRQSMLEHTKQHFTDEEFKCDICGKVFKSVKNLQNHKQIHDAIKRYVCKICGSAFAQAAGLYLHKRRHNRPNSRIRQSY